ncbi:MAG: hypothetical protein RBS57_03110 [Desulforhabdus sp.]|nr:hypothetical protein [Desulforhabdus sp.]
MRAGNNQAKVIELITRNPAGYLERALRTLKFYHSNKLVSILYNLKGYGSARAKYLLDQSTTEDVLLQQLPFGIFLQSLSDEERKILRLTLRTFEVRSLEKETVADLIAEIEQRFKQIRK